MTIRASALTLVICTAAFLLEVLVTPTGASAQAPPQVESPYFSPSGTTDISSMLRLTWTAPTLPHGTPSITGYEVQYRVDGGEAWEGRENWDDWIDHVFDSDGTTTETTITGLQSNTAYYAQVRTVNADGPGPWSQGILWAMTAWAELTVAFSSDTYTVREGESATTTVVVTPAADRDVAVTVEITDGSGATLSGLTDGMLTIYRGQGSADFTISSYQDDDDVNDEVTLTLSAEDYDYSLVRVSTSTAIVTVIDDDGSNSPPVITTTSPISVQENQTAVATLTATDPDDDPITGWSIPGGVDSTLFSLTKGGVLTFVVAPDYETPKDEVNNNSYEVKVTASDGTDNSAELTLIVNVTDVDEPPPSMQQPSFSASGTADTTSMLLLMWTAPTLPDGTPSISGYEVQYRMQGEADWVAHNFASDGSTTETTITGLASNTYYDAQVRAVNVEGPSGWSPTSGAKTTEARLTVAFSAAVYSVGEGDTADITVNVDPIADRDITVTVIMTGTGATLSGLGAGGTLTIARGQSSVTFTIYGDHDNDATDDEATLTLDPNRDDYVFSGSPFTATVTIVDDEEPNNPPVVTTTSPITVKENQTTVATLEATDSDDDTITGWSISGGAERALFNLTNGGVLSFKTAPDYENPKDTGSNNGYEIEVTASDGTDNSDPLMITVTVTDLNEPPGAPTGLSVSPNEENPTMALDVSWTAPDTTGIPEITGYDVQYRSGDSGSWTTHKFDSVSTTTKTTVSGLVSNTTYQVQVSAENDEGEGQWATGSGTTEKAQLTVTFSSATYTVGEGSTADININVDPIADRDIAVTVTMTGTGATLSGLGAGGTLTIKRGQSSVTFTIYGDQDNDATDNEVILTLNANQDDYVFLGSPFTTTVTIEELNIPPVVTTASPIIVEENQTAVATLEATDSDDDSITGWSITGGADSALFDLTNSGVLSFKTAPDYENPSDTGSNNSYEVEVTASDGTDDSTPKTLTVNVTDVNEPPRFSEGTITTRAVTENSPKVLTWEAHLLLSTPKTIRWSTNSPALVTRTSLWTRTDRLPWPRTPSWTSRHSQHTPWNCTSSTQRLLTATPTLRWTTQSPLPSTSQTFLCRDRWNSPSSPHQAQTTRPVCCSSNGPRRSFP